MTNTPPVHTSLTNLSFLDQLASTFAVSQSSAQEMLGDLLVEGHLARKVSPRGNELSRGTARRLS